ncbi:hypothetical protein HanIR_Chr15g0784971 [Helianthus annuus]|nr:hypothetical protein HanIR_Chr15g0784971 [Helianthus annuus]
MMSKVFKNQKHCSDTISSAELQDTGTSNRRRYIELQREEGHETLMADYFVEDPKYNKDIFRHRFRMSKRLFLKLVDDVVENDPWFEEAPDARGRKGFTPLQKVTSAIKQLATGNTPDENDEYLHMADRTSRECLEFFTTRFAKYTVPSSYVDRQATTWHFYTKPMRKNITFQVCLVALIAPILFGDIVRQSIEANLCEEITDTRLLCSKRLLLKTYGFRMLLPVHRVLKTISMCYNNLLYF